MRRDSSFFAKSVRYNILRTASHSRHLGLFTMVGYQWRNWRGERGELSPLAS